VVAWLLFLFVAVPVVEIYVIAKISVAIGGANALLLLILFSAAGAWLVKHEGLATARRVRSGIDKGRMPTSDVVDGLVILVAGVLLLTPGFVTTAVGLLLLVPPIRGVVLARLTASLARRVTRRAAALGFDVGAPGAPGAGQPSGAGAWRPGWAGPGGRPGPGPGPGPSSGRHDRRWRAYRRPGEPDPAAERVWGARVRDPATPDADVIDIEGEEIVFGDSGPELGPSR